MSEDSSAWSAAGDSLRQSLEDTLRIRFGEQSVGAVAYGYPPEGHHPYFEVASALAAAAFVPPVLALFIRGDAPSATNFPDHLALRVEGGISGIEEYDNRVHAASSVRLELWRSRWFGEASLVRIGAVSEDWRYLLRAGHMWRPHSSVRTGVTFGYRDADLWGYVGPTFVLGLPLQVGSESAVARFEPSYLASSNRVGWMYRLEFDFSALPNLHPGLGLTLRSNKWELIAIGLAATWRP